MAKKSQKPNLPQETLERARRELERSGDLPVQSVTTPGNSLSAGPKAAPAMRTATTHVDLAKEYSYVIEDLQQVAMLAAGILVVLVVLSLFV